MACVQNPAFCANADRYLVALMKELIATSSLSMMQVVTIRHNPSTTYHTNPADRAKTIPCWLDVALRVPGQIAIPA